jgi:hypothetical protein
MSDTYEKKAEKRFCYFIKGYAEVTVVKHRWLMIDGESWAEEVMGFECPSVRKCRRAEHNCSIIHPESGTDPFIPFRNLLADMW